MAWARKGKAGAYRVHYATADNASTADIPLVGGRNIADWWNPADIPGAEIAWSGRNDMALIGVYLYTWENPRPEMPIEKIDFLSADAGPILGLIAVTGQE